MSVHNFLRRVATDAEHGDLRTPYEFRTPLPNSPLSYVGVIVKIKWCVRLRLFLRGRWARVQLLWRSEQRLFYLFAGETPARTYSVTYRALERLNSAGLMQPLENRSLLERALDTVTRELARPS